MAEKTLKPASIAPDVDIAKSGGLAVDRFPVTQQEAEKGQDLLSKELERLSLQDHEKALFDVHGITPDIEEDPVMITAKLKDLDVALDKIQPKHAYDKAKVWNPAYVVNRNFRLLFLRCEEWNVEKAAIKLVHHFEAKQKLFGDGESLGREIRQSDLGPKDRQILESGFVQIVPSRDASGRTLMVLCSAAVVHFPADGWEDENEYRVLWYISMALLWDLETQKKGNVFLIFNYTGYKVSFEHFQGSLNIENGTPRRLTGAHYCYLDPELTPFVTGFQLFVNQHIRLRIRPHLGTHEEILFELQTFGIPTEYLPIGSDGSLSRDFHLEWVAMLRREEEKETQAMTKPSDNAAAAGEEGPTGFIVVPRKFDVLFGKQLSAREHTGTRRALHLVEMYYGAYEQAGKYQKTEVAEKLITVVHESYGRFLKQDDDGVWREVDDLEARKKIAHWFRHSRFKKSQTEEDRVKHEIPRDTEDRDAKRVPPSPQP